MITSVKQAKEQLATWNGTNRYLANEARQYLSKNPVVDELPKKEVVNKRVTEPVKSIKLTKTEIIGLSKFEQAKLIKSLTTEDIPRLEKDRVELILRLQ